MVFSYLHRVHFTSGCGPTFFVLCSLFCAHDFVLTIDFSFTEQLCWSHLSHFVYTFAATARAEEENLWRFLALNAQLLPSIKIYKKIETIIEKEKRIKHYPCPGIIFVRSSLFICNHILWFCTSCRSHCLLILTSPTISHSQDLLTTRSTFLRENSWFTCVILHLPACLFALHLVWTLSILLYILCVPNLFPCQAISRRLNFSRLQKRR